LATISANYADLGGSGSRAICFVVPRELAGEEEHQMMLLAGGRCLIENGLQQEEVAVSFFPSRRPPQHQSPTSIATLQKQTIQKQTGMILETKYDIFQAPLTTFRTEKTLPWL